MEDDIGYVAIIDDDSAVLESLGFMLEIAGYRVAAYASVGAFLNDSRSGLDCLILDHHIPGITGLELAARLRVEGMLVPVLLITGRPSTELFALAKELGINKVLEKPPSEDDLLQFVAANSGRQ